jgi:DNA-binding MarR family transcriptional regulator
LGELDLARRKVDPMDRRSVLVQRTTKGSAFLRDVRGIMTEASGGKKVTKKAA